MINRPHSGVRALWGVGLRLLACLGLRVRIPAGGGWGVWISEIFERCALLNSGLCDELFTRPEDFYRV